MNRLPALSLLTLLAMANTSPAQNLLAGKQVFANCAACHSLKPGENGLGPSLAGVADRAAGQVAGFRYSTALKRSGRRWDAATLDQFLRDPQAFIPGNRMPYSGLQDAQQRQDLIAYLAQPQ